MVVRISDVVLIVSWLSDGAIWFTLQEGLVAPVSKPSESTVESSLSNECKCWTEVSKNRRVAQLDVSREQAYPSQAERIDQFEFFFLSGGFVIGCDTGERLLM